MVLHIISAFPIAINPVFRAVEAALIDNRPNEGLKRIISRSIIMAIFIILAMFFPYFLDMMSIIADISVSVTGYMLPCVFYFLICKPRNPVMIICLIVVFLFGVVGSGVGLYVSISDMIKDVKANPNPFKGIFHFGG